MQMVQVPKICPQCHVAVKPTDYFCFNCGHALREKPKPVTVIYQLLIYTGSLLLPPLGFWWGYKYLKQGGSKARIVGIVCIALTIVSLVGLFVVTQNIVNTVNEQVNNAMPNLMGF